MAKEVLEMEVKSNIKNVTKDTDELGESIEKASDEAKDLGDGLADAGKKGGKGINKISIGFKGLMKAAGIVYLLQKAFEIFQETLGKNQKVVDFFSTSMTAVSIVFNDLFKVIESNVGPITEYFKALFEDPGTKVKELGDAIKQGLVDRFNEFLEVMGLVGKAFGKLIKGEFGAAFDTIKEAGKQVVDVYTGVDDSFEKVKETIKKGITAVKEYTKATIEQAVSVTESAKAAARAGVEFAKLNAQYLKEAEDQRKIRDNVNLSFKERIEANNKLSEVIKKQQKLQKEQVQTQIDAAQAQYDINASEENWIALQETKVAMLEVVEATEAQLSEQLTNQVGLENELLEVKKEILLAGLEGIALELSELENAYQEKLKMADKAGMATIEITKKYEKEHAAIVESYQNAEARSFEELSKNKVKWAEMTADEQMNVAAETAGNLSKVLGEETAAGKAAAIVQATISTYQGATQAFTSMSGIPYVGPVLGGIAAAAAVASGIKNVQAIISTGEGGGAAPSAAAAAPSASEQIPAPQMMSGAFELGGGIEPEPIKAFVVTDEMSNSQNQLANIRRRATI